MVCSSNIYFPNASFAAWRTAEQALYITEAEFGLLYRLQLD
jgi:hypothetical protein